MFITFEGPDGSGKTTAIKKVVKFFKSKNIDIILTREPGTQHTYISKKIREIIFDSKSNISPMTEAILFAADRRHHLENVIWPALKKNKVVLCDRYVDSTFVYQGYARGLGIKNMIKLNDAITEKTYPDLTIFFDVPVDISKKRILERGELNRLDDEIDKFFNDVYDGYRKVSSLFKRRFKVVDASQNEEQVYTQVLKILNNYF